jgi:hypothetical protein
LIVSDDNVIHAFQKSELPENPISIAPQPAGKPMYCEHAALRIDSHERTVACAKCGQLLDPFNFLLSNAVTLQRAWQDHAHVKREMQGMQERVTALKKEEARLRSMVKRLADKAGTVIDVRGIK